MKKLLTFVLASAILLMLCACGTTTVETVEETPAPVEETVEPTPEPTPEPREIKKVEITAENFLDYFDYVVTPDYDNAEKDDEGNITSLTVCYDYVLKAEYEAAWEQAKALPVEDFESLLEEYEKEIGTADAPAENEEEAEETDDASEETEETAEELESPVLADFEITYNDVLNPTEVDFENMSYAAFDDSTEQTFSCSVTADWWHADGALLEDGDSYDDASYKMTVLEFVFGTASIQEVVSIDITSASGVLYLYM